ncbi:hypothetical protein SGL43_01949 [Streptomyces globisporus]|uniref:Uncharacterized protein n=1 Tax=Streptomyces globisporus TaxID=1908 RepID=A0ABN8UX52_STRGL|nr:hypothetical protein SGL43_01949 [Streptomyces globisporus]
MGTGCTHCSSGNPLAPHPFGVPATRRSPPPCRIRYPVDIGS